jgi:hypothetical protein
MYIYRALQVTERVFKDPDSGLEIFFWRALFEVNQ